MINLVTDDAHDGVRPEHAGILATEINLPAKRLFIMKILVDEGLIDYGHVAGGSRVIFTNHAAANDRRAHDMGITAADGSHAGLIVSLRLFRLPQNGEAASQSNAGERRRSNQRS